MKDFAAVLWDLQAHPITNDKQEKKSAEWFERGVRETQDLAYIFNEKIPEIKKALNAGSYVRISSIPYLCPRQEVLAAVTGAERVEKNPATQDLIFGFGHKIHDLLQNDFFGPKGVLHGNWECAECGGVIEDSTMPKRCDACGDLWRCTSCELIIPSEEKPKVCPVCKNDRIAEDSINPFKMLEETLYNAELRIGGHCDGIFIVDGIRYLAEFKSIRGDLFMKLTEPYEAHIHQASLYAWLKGLKQVKIVYINKNGRNEKDFWKEFTFSVDQSVIDMLLARVQLIRDGIRDRVVPKREMCVNKSSTKARRCLVRGACFGGDFDG